MASCIVEKVGAFAPLLPDYIATIKKGVGGPRGEGGTQKDTGEKVL